LSLLRLLEKQSCPVILPRFQQVTDQFCTPCYATRMRTEEFTTTEALNKNLVHSSILQLLATHLPRRLGSSSALDCS
jgi:hypothetical protein